jgi:hypothetical protein
MVNATEERADELVAAECPNCGEGVDVDPEGHCKRCGNEVRASSAPAAPRFFALPSMRYPNEYAWLLFVTTLDLLMTLLVLSWWAGEELNPVVAAVIETVGLGGAMAVKFATMLLVILVCEAVGRDDDRLGRHLAVAATVISGVPVVYTFGMLLWVQPVPFENVLPTALLGLL